MKHKTVCVVGLGYVGLPLAETFSNHLKTVGFDIDDKKIETLNHDNNEDNLEFTSDPQKIKQADFVLIAVPTPVTKFKEPDLSFVKSAAKTVGKNLKKGAIRLNSFTASINPSGTSSSSFPFAFFSSFVMGNLSKILSNYEIMRACRKNIIVRL